MQRDDDQEDTVKKRLEVYHEQTEPLVSYYQDYANSESDDAPKYVEINGIGDVEAIRDTIFAALHGNLLHFGLQSSHLNNCYYHQDLH